MSGRRKAKRERKERGIKRVILHKKREEEYRLMTETKRMKAVINSRRRY
jgi:hypothetical protein